MFLHKTLLCIAGILILLLIAGTYCIHRDKEEKAPFLKVEEWKPQLEALQELGNVADGSIPKIDPLKQEYVTVGDIKLLLENFPDVDVSVLEEYKRDSRYMGLEDWNRILLQIANLYGGADLYVAKLTIIGDGGDVTDQDGNALEPDMVLTDRGIMHATYRDLNAFCYTRVKTVCFQDEILTVTGYGNENGVLKHVYVTGVSDEEVRIFTDNYHIRYAKEGGEGTAQKAPVIKVDASVTAGMVADLILKPEGIAVKEKKAELINGKLLKVSDTELEIEGYGIYPIAEDMKIYRLYAQLQSMEKKDLCIGYSFTDFVLEDGKVSACLMVKDEGMEYIRVLLKNTDYTGKYHDQFSAVCDQDCDMILYENGVEIERTVKKAGERIEIRAQETDMENKRIKLLPKVLSAKIAVESIKRNQGTPVYRGSMEIRGTGEGLIVINEVLLEDYLCKVVPSEMPSSYPMEALKAQAVCARTYAYGKMKNAGLPDLGAHVDDSVGFQVYNNIQEQISTTEAVKETHAIVALSEDEPIGTYYYSTSSGMGTDPSIWHGTDDVPSYLGAKYMSTSAEHAKRTPEKLMDEEAFREWIMQTDPNSLEAEEAWYRWTYTVEKLDAETLTQALQKRYESNPQLILTKDQNGEYVSAPIRNIGKIFEITIERRLAGGVADEMTIRGEKAVVKVISELNIRYVLADGNTKVHRQNGDEVSASSLPSAYIVLDTEKKDGIVTGYKITGGGFGHGVGMSQNGAKCMAWNGNSYEEILQFFYPGIELKAQ